MERIYHPYWKWEDYIAGMWRKETKQNEKTMLPIAIEFTGNADLYGKWMLEVIHRWPYACENNLTDISHNRRAWIGHAAVQLAINIPEYITRQAWGELTEEQRIEANKKADQAILQWELDNGHKESMF